MGASVEKRLTTVDKLLRKLETYVKKRNNKNVILQEKYMSYTDQQFKIPIESTDYQTASKYAIKSIEEIISSAISKGENKIIINTNLKLGLPMENINKIAGPFIEAWACETFTNIVQDQNNSWNLINVEALERLNRADVLLQH